MRAGTENGLAIVARIEQALEASNAYHEILEDEALRADQGLPAGVALRWMVVAAWRVALSACYGEAPDYEGITRHLVHLTKHRIPL